LPFRRTMTSLRLYLWSRISLYFLSTKSESCTNGQRSTKSFDIT
jgi:hypothetical protein